MRIVYHFPLSPFSRKVRLALKEKDLPFELVTEPFWERRPEFIALNPAGEVQVLVEEDGSVYSEALSICEYLEEVYPQRNLLGAEIRQRAEVRRIVDWFDHHFYMEVSHHILEERLYKFMRHGGEPQTRNLHSAAGKLHGHLEYLTFLLKRRPWLAGDMFSLADITAASHLSVLDYFADVPWAKYPAVKEWYAVLKSRPSFRPLLADRIPGFKVPAHYADLDF